MDRKLNQATSQTATSISEQTCDVYGTVLFVDAVA